MVRSSHVSRIGIILLTTLGAGVLAAPAQAATTGVVSVAKSTQVQYKAGSGKASTVVVTRSGKTVTIDDKYKIKAGKGCKQVKGDKTKVRCKLKKNPTRVLVHAGDKNDKVTNKTGIPSLFDGGTGNDSLWGGSKADKLYGGTGNDYLSGGAGNDALYGQAGNDTGYGKAGHDKIYGGGGNDRLHGDSGYYGDTGNDKIYGEGGNDSLIGWRGNDYLSGGAGNDGLEGDLDGDNYNTSGNGADTLLGGSGVDTVRYDTYGTVRVDLDGQKGDDGRAGERDTVGADVENIVAGDSNGSVLIGNTANNVITSGEGADKIYGLGGNDTLDGSWGKDELHGGDGDDTLIGVDHGSQEIDADKLDGGANTDTCKASTIDIVVNCEK
ncbi:calcium-binding protein [Actinoplanes sp. NPDC023936]|uniref:calcium-binding protein n=1 Tax=Actinoplanes sp. NPDC023936 TaxID=3154910 RepID=UPI0033FDDAB4